MADRIRVFYDSQCGFCRTAVSWLHALDRRPNRTECIPMTTASIAQAGLDPAACARALHAVTPHGTLAGWDAVAYLARLFPATWLPGALGSVPPFRWLGKSLYACIASHRCSHGTCL
jgi:predicted DCC family thiol-disulfide oxidoreductase YuxK